MRLKHLDFDRALVLAAGVTLSHGCVPKAMTPTSEAPAQAMAPPVASAEMPPPGEPAELAPLEVPLSAGVWWQPRPVLNVEPLSAAEQQGAQACVNDHRVNDPQIDASRALAAADCFAAVRSYGLEMQLLQVIIVRFPKAAEVRQALERKGLRYEQLDRRDKAMAAYMMYLRLYPKDEMAREYGQRAVCLAHSIGNEYKASQLLSALEHFFEGQSFMRPVVSELEYLCEGLRPVAPDQ